MSRVLNEHETQRVVQINRNTMLARVSHYVAPATRRRAIPNLASTSHATAVGAARLEGSLDRDSLPVVRESSDLSPAVGREGLDGPGAPPAAGGGPEDATPCVLKGKPSQVIQRFVKDHNIDLLVIPVTPQARLRRMAKESKRGAAATACGLSFGCAADWDALACSAMDSPAC